jgi:protein-S-isoprenylcysteine O-methyltransferase Ste14
MMKGVHMTLRHNFEKAGNWLFRWRSYLPLGMLGLMLIIIQDFTYIGNSHQLDMLWEGLCLTISLFGFGIRIYTIGHVPKGTSGRNTKAQRAAELNTTGIYSIVRHPLYMGNFFIYLGISLFVHIWWFTLLYILAFWIYYERIMFAEEAFLRETFGEVFETWAAETPACIPDFKKWNSPILPFSFKHVLNREYSGFFGIIATFTILDVVGDSVATGKIAIDGMWSAIFTLGLLTYVTLRTLRKKTNILQVDGR